MADKIIENNQVSMMGKIAAGFTFSHQVFGEGFYTTGAPGTQGCSDSEDRIPVMVSETAAGCNAGLHRRICGDPGTVPLVQPP